MVNTELEFVFVHINKCGGTSVEQAFGHRGRKHHHCDHYREHLGPERWQRYFKFSIVRNPYARLVSMYHYRVQRDLRVRGREFGEWLQTAEDEDQEQHSGDSSEARRQRLMLAPMVDWITSAEGVMEMDFVARLETIADDWLEICRRLGVHKDLPHANRTEHRPWSDYYDASSRRKVEQRYLADFEAFGYDFEHP